MTNMTRSSTLSLRRPAAQALTTSRASKASAPAATPSTERSGSAASVSSSEANAGERVIRSETLLQGRSHISITHNGETYQLRATRLGKLILTK
jgi:hemin uptake protein HemP